MTTKQIHKYGLCFSSLCVFSFSCPPAFPVVVSLSPRLHEICCNWLCLLWSFQMVALSLSALTSDETSTIEWLATTDTPCVLRWNLCRNPRNSSTALPHQPGRATRPLLRLSQGTCNYIYHARLMKGEKQPARSTARTNANVIGLFVCFLCWLLAFALFLHVPNDACVKYDSCFTQQTHSALTTCVFRNLSSTRHTRMLQRTPPLCHTVAVAGHYSATCLGHANAKVRKSK
jgi:hypothetical protein